MDIMRGVGSQPTWHFICQINFMVMCVLVSLFSMFLTWVVNLPQFNFRCHRVPMRMMVFNSLCALLSVYFAFMGLIHTGGEDGYFVLMSFRRALELLFLASGIIILRHNWRLWIRSTKFDNNFIFNAIQTSFPTKSSDFVRDFR